MKLQSWLVRMSLLTMLTPLAGCQWVTTVENVQQHPHRNWFTATVYLQGTVGQQAPLIDGQLYQLQDRTGTIWVLSRTTNLKKGQQILIKGRVRYQAIEIEGQDLSEVYIEEQQQLEPK